jgi:hypothetical protein
MANKGSVGFLLVTAIKRVLKMTTNDQLKEKQPYNLGNLMILGTAGFLRAKGKDVDHIRYLYNMNQLWTHVERRLCFEDWFVQVSKFRMMKLSSMVMGRVINNNFEAVARPTLVPYCTLLFFSSNIL